MSLKHKTIGGVLWSTAGRFAQQLISFLVIVVLARLLTPSAFGLIGMTVVFVGFAKLFSDFGLSSALVHRERIVAAHSTSIFWVNLAIGLLLAILFAVAAPAVASFYSSPELKPITRVLGLSFFVGAFGIVPRALLQRRLAFGKLAAVEVVSESIAGIIAVTLALFGWGVWSLVVQTLAASIFAVVIAGYFARWLPRGRCSLDAVKDLLGFGANLSGFNILNYWARNGDNLLVGKYLGAFSLGIYVQAYRLMLLPITQLTAVATRVMFPVLSSIQGDKRRVRSIYLRAISVIALLGFPMMAGLFVTARPFVLAVYGPKWAAAIPVIQILCVVGAVQALLSPTGWIYTSQGRTDWMFRWGAAASAITLGGIAVGVWIGSLQSVALSYLVANCITFLPSLWISGRLIDLSVTDLLRAVRAPFLCSVAMAILVAGVGWLLPPYMTMAARLILEVTIGAAAYVAIVALFRLPIAAELRRLLWEYWGRSAQSVESTVGVSTQHTSG